MRSALWRLIGAQIFLHAAMTGLRMAAPLMALRDGQGPATVGILLALFATSQVFLALPAGRYVDRHGLRRPVRRAVFITVAGASLAVAWPVFPVLCLAALATGAGSGITVIALQRHAGRMVHDAHELRQVFSWLAIGPSISNFLGPFVAGLLIDASGFRAAYAFLAVLPLLAWAWVHRVKEHAVEEAPLRPAGQRSWDLLGQPDFRRLMLVNWLLASCWDVHTFLVPVLGHERGFSATAIGSILGAFALAATAVRVAMPWLAARLREGVVVGSAMVATALLFALYPLVQSAPVMTVLSVMLGVALGSVQPMVMSTLHQITPRHRHGEALGLRSMAINLSSVIMPLLFGSAGTLVGVAVVFWSVGTVVGAGSRLAFRIRAAGREPVRLSLKD
ncbi:MAG: MFS transporter [Gammaproteobacteria bacterium]